MSQPRVSAAVLTLDEARNISRCLASLAWADEIVVVDSGSTDGTLELARGFTDKVIHHPWAGFLEQRRFSFEQCSHEWIVFLDADEWMGPELAREIRQVVSSSTTRSAFWIDRRNWFLDRWMDHAWSPDLVLRLFRKGSATLEGHEPHIHLHLEPGRTAGVLEHPLMHQAYHSIADLCVKADRYSTQFAESSATDAQFATWKIVLSPLVSAFKTLVVKRGFLDGWHGFVIAWASAYYHFLKYAKKWERSRRAVEGVQPSSTPLVPASKEVECTPGSDGHGR